MSDPVTMRCSTVYQIFPPPHLSLPSIREIQPPAFQDLHSLEWIKLANNDLKTLHYELMEPVLDSLMHIDLHSESIS